MKVQRRSGILLHPTSLPGAHGSGDLGAAAYHFVDWLVAGGQTLWQILPAGGIGPGNSPYMSPSALAGNELLIDLFALEDSGWLSESDTVAPPHFDARRVDYAAQRRFRFSRLRVAAERFFGEAQGADRDAFAAFCRASSEWLDDYALFMALDRAHGEGGKVWQDWPAALARRQETALVEAAAAFVDECNFWCFCQWCFFSQWGALKAYANARGVEIIGDMPIFVSPHSADVWAHQHLFDLDDGGRPRVVAGVPPDYFSETGQLWGNPLYAWAAHEREGYRWWIARMRTLYTLCDIVRIDHFRGFESYWEIPADAATAIAGRWRKGPGAAVFAALHQALANEPGDGASGTLRIIAEDLGIITAEVRALREELDLPGMRVLQFAFDGHSDNLYLPHNFESRTVVYTGTHDNDTSCGWWQSLSAAEQDYVRRYLGVNGDAIHWDLIRAASASVAKFAIVPMQDVLGLDSAHRMNQPGQAEGAWEWRFGWDQVHAWHAELLLEFATLHGRLPLPETAP
jgi:4-alpha-glucanotransferase